MSCLEPDKKVMDALGGTVEAIERQAVAKISGFNLPLVSRKLRELKDRELILENDGKYSLTDKGREVLEVLNKQGRF